MRHLVLAVVLLFAPPPAFAADDGPGRRGFTVELGIGLGAIQVDGLPGEAGVSTDVGIEPHSVSLGAFVNSRLAVMYRWSSAYYFATNAAGDTAQGVLGTHGIQLQLWFGQRWFVAGGPAVAFFGNVIGRDTRDPAIRAGVGATARAGYMFARFGAHGFRLSAKIVSGFFSDRIVAGQTLNLAYQWL